MTSIPPNPACAEVERLREMLRNVGDGSVYDGCSPDGKPYSYTVCNLCGAESETHRIAHAENCPSREPWFPRPHPKPSTGDQVTPPLDSDPTPSAPLPG